MRRAAGGRGWDGGEGQTARGRQEKVQAQVQIQRPRERPVREEGRVTGWEAGAGCRPKWRSRAASLLRGKGWPLVPEGSAGAALLWRDSSTCQLQDFSCSYCHFWTFPAAVFMVHVRHVMMLRAYAAYLKQGTVGAIALPPLKGPSLQQGTVPGPPVP